MVIKIDDMESAQRLTQCPAPHLTFVPAASLATFLLAACMWTLDEEVFPPSELSVCFPQSHLCSSLLIGLSSVREAAWSVGCLVGLCASQLL